MQGASPSAVVGSPLLYCGSMEGGGRREKGEGRREEEVVCEGIYRRYVVDSKEMYGR